VAAIGILGGTFDPVHNGHLRLALEMLERLALSSVRLVPAPNPRLREPPQAGAEYRIEMLRLAIDGVSGLEIDTRELGREGPTHTVETLESLRAELPEESLCLIVGMDAFRRLDDWHRWRELSELAHIVVARRPGAEPPASGAVNALAERCGTEDPQALHATTCGRVFYCDLPLLDISATRIRRMLAEGRSIRFLVPDKVLESIERTGCYTNAE